MFKYLTLALFAASPALAQDDTHNPTLKGGCFGEGTPLFHCTLNGGKKAVDLCLQGDVILYRFGPSDGAAELLLARSVLGVHLEPWNGVGRYLWEELTLHNSVYSYLVSYSIDRMAGEDDWRATGGIRVAEGDSELADLACDEGSITAADFYPVFEAKEVSGQCYSRDDFSWKPC